jgi:hypothetical protein
MVPFRRNPDFIGRDEFFKNLTTRLTVKKGPQARVALWGLGGVGYVSVTYLEITGTN